MSEQFFDVGKIVNTHGIRGEIKVLSVTDFPEERYAKGQRLFISHPSLKEPISVTVESAKPQKNTYIVKLKEYSHINDVEKFKGGALQIPESERGELEEDEFYYHEILDCTVWSDEGQKIGVVKEILTTGANDVWVVKQENGKDILLPYIEDCILEIDVEEKKIIAHILEGLI